jgi:CRISPR-associated endonuclease Cas1
MPARMHPMLDLEAWDAANDDASLVIADGPSVTIQVHGSMLVVTDGPKGNMRKREYPRVPRKIKRLIILSRHGYVSLNAMDWLASCGIAWTAMSREGQSPRTLGTSGGYVNPIYMRKQAMCAPGGPLATTGVKIWRHLIVRKLEGQAVNAETFLADRDAAAFIRAQIPLVESSRSVDVIRGLEGAAADRYWDCWRDTSVGWQSPKPRQPHWLEYPSRRTLRRTYESNRGATDPVNAALNFAYKIAETECTLACYAAALSPSMGIGHVDRANSADARDSFALDLIEVMRPIVDRIVHRITSKSMNKNWYRENGEGMVQCCAPLTHRIAADVYGEGQHIYRALFGVTALLDNARRPSRKVRLTVAVPGLTATEL